MEGMQRETVVEADEEMTMKREFRLRPREDLKIDALLQVWSSIVG